MLKVGNVVYVGCGGRTNGEGIRQLRSLLAPHGMSVVAVPVTKVLHLKSAVTALPDGTIIGYEPLVDDTRIFERFLPVPEESGSHVVDLGEGRLLMAADAPQSAALFRSLGYTPVEVDIGEFQKLEGCVTCLSVRLRRPVDGGPAADGPRGHALADHAGAGQPGEQIRELVQRPDDGVTSAGVGEATRRLDLRAHRPGRELRSPTDRRPSRCRIGRA